ncbi:hypothetical protein REPUB_Repub06bG0049700 [Reevesia pubescens]
MEDGTLVMTEVVWDISSNSMFQCLCHILQHMVEVLEDQDMVVGLDITWSPSSSDYVLLAFCTRTGCVLDVEKLRKHFRLEIRNAVELSELAADVLHQPRLRAFGLRGLASEVLLLPFKTRSSSMDPLFWVTDLKTAEIECATTDAYAAYKTGKKLLGV